MNQDTINWLTEKDNPPVRYLTLTKLLRKNPANPEVIEAQESLMDYPVTQSILEQGDKFWNLNEKAYWKYTGKYWQIIFLGQFLADGHDPRIQDQILDVIEKREWIHNRGGQCLTANMLSAFIRLGFYDHPVVREEVETLAQRAIREEGIMCEVMDLSLLPRCYMSIPKLLLCFGLVPQNDRSGTLLQAIDLLIGSLISNEIYNYVPVNNGDWKKVLEAAPKKADMPKGQTVKQWIKDRKELYLVDHGFGGRKPKPGWTKFGFPLHYNSDILEAMYALALLETPMVPELDTILHLIRDKANSEGRWIMENSLNGKMLADVEEKGKPSKWLTYFALYTLNHFG